MKRILIADGNVEQATRLQQALELRGHRTAHLADGGQFLGFCQQHQPDLVIVDVDLPVVNGWAAVHGLRGEDSTSAIPAIGLSAHASAVELQQAHSIGFQGLLAKPLEFDQALATIEAVIVSGVPATQPGESLGQEPARAAAEAEELSVSVTAEVIGSAPAESSFDTVRRVIEQISTLVAQLAPHAAQLGADGPELFGYIEGGEKQITEQLRAVEALGPEAAEHALYDRELRHDFRNMIGSVTGFAELILMEGALEPAIASALKQIRQYSSEFVRLLDAQKAAAAAA